MKSAMRTGAMVMATLPLVVMEPQTTAKGGGIVLRGQRKQQEEEGKGEGEV